MMHCVSLFEFGAGIYYWELSFIRKKCVEYDLSVLNASITCVLSTCILLCVYAYYFIH